MSENKVEVKLEDGTLIRHKVAGYEGRIEGTTKIQSCFTLKGNLLPQPNSKQLFQYRVMVEGESLHRIAPADDFEIRKRSWMSSALPVMSLSRVSLALQTNLAAAVSAAAGFARRA